jgi:hypothetical protein
MSVQNHKIKELTLSHAVKGLHNPDGEGTMIFGNVGIYLPFIML